MSEVKHYFRLWKISLRLPVQRAKQSVSASSGPHLYLEEFVSENGDRENALPRHSAQLRAVKMRRAAEAWSKLRESVAELGRQNREALSKRLRQRRKS